MSYSTTFHMNDLLSNGQPSFEICPHCKKKIHSHILILHLRTHYKKQAIFKKQKICFCGHTDRMHSYSKVKCLHHKLCFCDTFTYHHTENRPHNAKKYFMPYTRIHLEE